MDYQELWERYQQIIEQDANGGLVVPDWQWTLDQPPLTGAQLLKQLEGVHRNYIASLQRNLACLHALGETRLEPEMCQFLLQQIERNLRRHARLLTGMVVGGMLGQTRNRG